MVPRFNLPSHEAFRLIGSPWPVSLLHFAFSPPRAFATCGASRCSPTASCACPAADLGGGVGDRGHGGHVRGWSDFPPTAVFVIFFGVLIPVTGVSMQAFKLREPTGRAGGVPGC